MKILLVVYIFILAVIIFFADRTGTQLSAEFRRQYSVRRQARAFSADGRFFVFAQSGSERQNRSDFGNLIFFSEV